MHTETNPEIGATIAKTWRTETERRSARHAKVAIRRILGRMTAPQSLPATDRLLLAVLKR